VPPSSKPKSNQLCPCGSGKKYRECHAVKDERRRRVARQTRKALIWIAAVAVVGAAAYSLSLNNVAYGERALGVIDFSGLSAPQKQTALRQANAARCTCGCGLGLAECVATDSTCPIRTDNIARIRSMVAAAMP
jgi:hypothetical protein